MNPAPPLAEVQASEVALSPYVKPAHSGRIKVLHFVECWLPLTETWLYSHLNALPAIVESHVVCQWTANLEHFPQRSLRSLERPPRQHSLLERAGRKLGLWDYEERHLSLLEQTIREVKPDVLHSHFGHYGWINSKVSKRWDLPHVVSFYGLDVGYLPHTQPRWNSRYRSLSSRVDRVLCEGPHMARSIAALGVNTEQIEVFRLGIDLDRVPFVARKNPASDTLKFLVAGSFREKKGIPFAIEAVGLFRRSHPQFDVEITVVGDAGQSPREQIEKERIVALVQQFDLAPRTRFLGYQSHDQLIAEFYRNDILIAPSVTESDGDTEGGAPVTVIEAAASGMAVVSTRHCDIPFVLSEANSAFLAPERDARALCRAIEDLIACKDWAHFSSANRSLIEAELDVKKQGERLAEIYENVIAR